jgi:hypothetical protein
MMVNFSAGPVPPIFHLRGMAPLRWPHSVIVKPRRYGAPWQRFLTADVFWLVALDALVQWPVVSGQWSAAAEQQPAAGNKAQAAGNKRQATSRKLKAKGSESTTPKIWWFGGRHKGQSPKRRRRSLCGHLASAPGQQQAATKPGEICSSKSLRCNDFARQF